MFLVAISLRILPWLTNFPLHRDEALYGYWAQLIASGRDPLLLSPWVDKPPLVLYLLAADIRAFGASELALRLPGLIASLLLVLVTFGFARRANGISAALVAAGLLTLSPFAILFAPTAFTDPWLALWLVAAAWAALARRPFLAGLLLGLAIASKQQGLLGVPLVFALLIAQGEEARRRRGEGKNLRSSAPPLLCSSARSSASRSSSPRSPTGTACGGSTGRASGIVALRRMRRWRWFRWPNGRIGRRTGQRRWVTCSGCRY